jgi:hypothetical protein
MDEQNEFMKQFAGSGAANMVTLLVLGLVMGLKKLCDRKSKCKSHIHCPCLDVDIRDDRYSTQHGEIEAPQLNESGKRTQESV